MRLSFRHTRFMGMLFFTIVANLCLNAQTAANREEIFKKMESKMVFPLIKGGAMCGVLPVENLDIKSDPDKEVKLMFDFTQSTSTGNQAVKINEGLEEVARILNLHVLAGTKKEKLKAVIVFHSGAIFSVFTDAYYREKYQGSNPNLDLLTQLSAAGVQMVVCGQSLALREIPRADILPFIQVAVAAKTTLSKYHAQGFYEFIIKNP